MSVEALEIKGKTYRKLELFTPEEFKMGVAYGMRVFVIDGEPFSLHEENPLRSRRCENDKDLLVRVEDLLQSRT
jgi:hypothetical protein